MAYTGDKYGVVVVKNTFLEVVDSCDEDIKESSRRRSASSPPVTSATCKTRRQESDDRIATSAFETPTTPPRASQSTSPLSLLGSAGSSSPPKWGECASRCAPRPAGVSHLDEERAKFDRGVQMPPPEAETQTRTTIMLRNLPNCYTRAMLCELLDKMGFKGRYNFFYLPIDFSTKASLGYCFVNLVRANDVPRFWQAFEGYSAWVVPTQKQARISWTDRQGLRMNLRYYRNSAVMHATVPDEYKPIFLEKGRRVAFPPPTQKIKAPRMQTERGHKK